MTPAEHWEEADTIVTGDRCDYGCPHPGCGHEMSYLVRALVHATLAMAADADARVERACTAMSGLFSAMPPPDEDPPPRTRLALVVDGGRAVSLTVAGAEEPPRS